MIASKLLTIFTTVALVSGHGLLTNPQPRQYRENGLKVGMNPLAPGAPIVGPETWTSIQDLAALNGGRGGGDSGDVGLCGDIANRNIFTAPNLYGPRGISVRELEWVSNGVAKVDVRITAYHAGHFEFRLAVPTDGGRDRNRPITQGLLNEHVLEIDESTPNYANVINYAAMRGYNGNSAGDGLRHKCSSDGGNNPAPFPSGSCCRNGGNCSPAQSNKHRYVMEFAPNRRASDNADHRLYTIHLKIPSDINCERCILQWYYQTANSPGSSPESFRNCADVAIRASAPSPTPISTPPPVGNPSSCSVPNLDNAVVAIRTYHGRYVVAESDKNTIRANRERVGDWEKFKLKAYGGGRYALETYHRRYVVAERDFTIRANRQGVGAWEQFILEPVDPCTDKYALKTYHGRYVAAERDYTITANRQRVGAWETFRILLTDASPTPPPVNPPVGNSSPRCVSKVSHIPDTWCEQVKCDPVYNQYCEWSN